MNSKSVVGKKTASILAAGALSIALIGTAVISTPAPAEAKAASASVSHSKFDAHAVQTLNSFYKPALKGQFPNFYGFTVGSTTKQAVIKAIGPAPEPGKDSDAFDVYHAEMGHPGYAVSYKLNKIREMRYFGTNVERQTNIGGISLAMLVHEWGAPNKSATFKAGKQTQKKVTYVRGSFQLEFIFNSPTDLDHINLTDKG